MFSVFGGLLFMRSSEELFVVATVAAIESLVVSHEWGRELIAVFAHCLLMSRTAGE